MKRFRPWFALMLSLPGAALAHAIPTQMIPAANAALAKAPAQVSIYFDAELEPLFCKLVVTNDQGRKVSRGDGTVDAHNHRLLTARLGAQGKGAYRVLWSVVSRDGHRASGDYAFAVQ